MQGLMLKLLNVDAAGERALRVVSYFDQLAMHVPDLDAVVRATAVIADCPAGISLPSIRDLRFTPEGALLDPSTPIVISTKITVGGDDGEEAIAWLERPNAVGELDEFILERMGLAVTAVLQRRSSPFSQLEPVGLSDPALVQVLVSSRTNDAERSRAARLLGLEPASQIRVVALAITPTTRSSDELERWLRSRWGRPVHVAQISRELGVAIAVGANDLCWDDAAYEGRGAIGPAVTAVQAPQSWDESRAALMFAGTSVIWPRLMRSEDIGSLSLVLNLDADAVRRNSDVRLLDKLHGTPSGTESLRILDYVVHHDSLRSAAREANFHHSSLQSRVARLEREFGFTFRSGAGRDRLSLALLLWHLYVGTDKAPIQRTNR